MVLGYNADLRCYWALTSTHGTTEVMGKSDAWYPTQSYSRKALLQSMLRLHLSRIPLLQAMLQSMLSLVCHWHGYRCSHPSIMRSCFWRRLSHCLCGWLRISNRTSRLMRFVRRMRCSNHKYETCIGLAAFERLAAYTSTYMHRITSYIHLYLHTWCKHLDRLLSSSSSWSLISEKHRACGV